MSDMDINALSPTEASEAFVRCCGSPVFGERMAAARPFRSHGAMVAASRRIWHNECSISEWRLAFDAHPRIGDVSQLREKFASTAKWCEGEQSTALESADESVLLELAEWNRKYEEKFGHIFIVCASGKPASVILAALKERYPNAPFAELGITAAEQQKITEIRLAKLDLSFDRDGDKSRLAAVASHVSNSVGAHQPPPPPPRKSPVTTHVLDTTRGRPAVGVAVTLETVALDDGSLWTVTGVTDGDGRVGNLLSPEHDLRAGQYRVTFEVEPYLRETTGTSGFYPTVSIDFTVRSSGVKEHYHVPLLLNPFGYSTYRGS